MNRKNMKNTHIKTKRTQEQQENIERLVLPTEVEHKDLFTILVKETIEVNGSKYEPWTEFYLTRWQYIYFKSLYRNKICQKFQMRT